MAATVADIDMLEGPLEIWRVAAEAVVAVAPHTSQAGIELGETLGGMQA